MPAEAALRETWTAASNGQEQLMTLVQTQDPVARAAALVGAQAAGQAKDAAWSRYRQHALGRPGERALQRSYETAAARSVKLAARVLGMKPAEPGYASTLASERREAENLGPRSHRSNRRSTSRSLVVVLPPSSRESTTPAASRT